MKRLWLAATMLAAAAVGHPASGQSARWRPWASNVVVPQARSYAMAGAPALQITAVNVGAVIRDQSATTLMEVRLRNPGHTRQEAELLLPVPDGAVVRGFSFEGAGAEPSARLLASSEARTAYDQIVAQSRDPAILEFAGYHLVRSSVFPVEPGGTQAVRITYEHLLPAEGDRIDYVLPRSESLEYGVPWKVAVKVESSSPLTAVYSPSHPLRTARPSPSRAAVEVVGSGSTGAEPGPFRLSLLRERGDVSASLFAYPDPKVGGGYFLLLAGLPPRPSKEKPKDHDGLPTLKREVTLVIDRSGSMRGEKLAQTREAALQVLAGLDDGEAFNVILYNEGVEPFAERPVRKSRAAMKEVTEFLEGMTARGGTNIHDALLDALRQPTADGTLPIVLFMTDGLPTVGQTSESSIRELAHKGNPHGRRIFSFGVGVDLNTPLLEKIAYETRGTATFVLPGEDVEVKVANVFKRLHGPVLAEPVLKLVGPDARSRTHDLIPAKIPDVFEGDQIVLLGRYVGDAPLEFSLKGNYRGASRVFRFTLPLDRASTRNGFVPRLWASRKIGLLVDAIREQGGVPSPGYGVPAAAAPRELVDEVVRLSTEFGVLTEYTAFLAREGTDFSRKDQVLSQASSLFRDRAVQTRSGLGAVNQDVNNQLQKSLMCANPRNEYLDSAMNTVATTTVQQVGDLAFYKRGPRWVDSRLVADAPGARAERVVEFGSDEFRDLVSRLAREGRQGCVSLRGDVLMLVDGQAILVKAPAGKP